MLFCEELSRYVTVESLTGVPYRKLEEIGNARIVSEAQKYEKKEYKDLLGFYDDNDESRSQFNQILTHFTDYYLSLNTLQLSFCEGRWKPGMPYFDYMISISNAFISWFNQFGSADSVEGLYRKNIIQKVTIKEGKFYQNKTITPRDMDNFNGRHLMDFKGQPVNIRIFRSDSPEERTTIILNHKITMFLLGSILRIINYHYRNEYNNNAGAGFSYEDTAPTYQTVCYL